MDWLECYNLLLHSYILTFKCGFGPDKLPGRSRNGPLSAYSL